jgi:hypothetical protein
MDEIREMITSVTDAYEKARPTVAEHGISGQIHRAVSNLVGDLAQYEWRVMHSAEGDE